MFRPGKEPDKKAAAASGRAASRRAHSAKQSRSDSAHLRDIGPLPAVADPNRRKRCLANLLCFNETYFPERYYLDFSDDHKTIIKKQQAAITTGGQFCLAMDRSAGKTTLTVTSAIFAVLAGHHIFVALIGADLDAAAELLASIKTEFEFNDLLAADFPEICYPIRRLEGIAHRCKGQTHLGHRTLIEWGEQSVTLPTIAGSATSGATIRARGITGRIRGMQRTLPDGRVIRPSLVILDDPQTDESAYSDGQCAYREKIIKSAVLNLAGPGKKITAILPGTVIRNGCLVDRLVDRNLNPEWTGERFAALLKFPKRLDLWEGAYDEIRREELAAGRGLEKATAYYRRHKKAMRAGAKVAWQARFNPDELDALQHLMNLFLEDRASFFAEQQQRPEKETDDDPDLLEAADVLLKTNTLERATVPAASTRLVAFCDVQKHMIIYGVAALADDFTGDIIEYGTFPDQKVAYWQKTAARHTLAQRYPRAGMEGRIYNGLCATIDGHIDGETAGDYPALALRDWKCDDGTTRRLNLCLIDARFLPDTVFDFAKASDFAAWVLPAQGIYIGARHKPISADRAKARQAVGPWWKITPDPKHRGRKVLVDANVAKTFLHARLAQATGDSGRWRLYGRRGGRKLRTTAHQLFADHVGGSHNPTKTTGSGRSLVEWVQKRGNPDDDFFDVGAGLCTAGSLLGCRLPSEPTPKPRRRGRKTAKPL